MTTLAREEGSNNKASTVSIDVPNITAVRGPPVPIPNMLMPTIPTAVYTHESGDYTSSIYDRMGEMVAPPEPEFRPVEAGYSDYFIEDDDWEVGCGEGTCGFLLGVVSGPLCLLCLKYGSYIGNGFTCRDKLTNGILVGTIVQLLALTITVVILTVQSWPKPR